MTASQRIRHIIESKNLTIEAFSKQTGTPRGTLNQMFKNDSNPKLPLLKACLELFPHLNARWLITGKGSPWEFKKSVQNHQIEVLQKRVIEMEDLMDNVVLKMEKQVTETFIDIKKRIEKLENSRKRL